MKPIRYAFGPAALLSYVFASALALAGVPAHAEDAKLRAAIEKADADFVKAVAAKDAAAIAAMYTEDAQVMPPNSPPVKGRAAIQQLFAGMVQGIARLEITAVEVEGHGDVAHEVEALKFFDASGKQIDEGKAIVIWKKVGGEWKLHRDIFSSNMPPPGAAPGSG